LVVYAVQIEEIVVSRQSFLSVIIPTRDRTGQLLEAVGRLLNQLSDVDHRAEVIVVDDGSVEDVETPLMNLASQWPGAVRYMAQPPQGPAAARNLGIRAARGDLVLFLGDDIYASPGLLQRHMTAHTVEYPDEQCAVLGMADLAMEFRQTPFVEWWRRWNFRYWLLLEGRRKPDYSFFYTNNLSLKRSFLMRCGMFDESFPYAAYEDGELGCRLTKHGLRVVFVPEACAEHYHRMDLDAACRRMVVKGKAYDLFVEKTGMFGISQIWKAVGTGPWMRPIFIRPLFRLAKWLQTRAAVSPVYILVLMYCFQVGRQRCPSIPEMD
jgi:glycosyltransferase involved in cell wall biosynthesis